MRRSGLVTHTYIYTYTQIYVSLITESNSRLLNKTRLKTVQF